MKINIKNLIVAGVAVALAFPALALAQAVEGQNIGGVVAGVPTVEGQNTGGATTGAPAGDGQNSGGGTSVPASEGQNTGGGSSVPVSEGQNTGGATQSSNNGGGSSNSGGGSSSSGGSTTISSSGSRMTIYPTSGVSGSCVLLTNYLHPGNTGSEVTKLQTFLKNLNYIINITGVYDAQTTQAVMAFQLEYGNDILVPWGITKPTGHVYLTTLNKINTLSCGRPILYTAAELAEINAYKSRPIGSPEQVVGMGNGSNLNGSVISPSNNSTDDTTVIVSTDNASDTQVAAVGKTSIFWKIWEFIKRIFGR